MANLFTISAPNEDWAPLVLGPDDDQLPKAIEGRLTHGEAVRYRFAAPTVRQIEPLLRSLAVPRHALVNGEPDRSMNGRSFAQTLSSGRLVTITHEEGNTTLTDSGIMVVVSSALGPGGPLTQSLELVFFPMAPGSRLYNAAGTYEELPEDSEDDDGEGEGEGEGE